MQYQDKDGEHTLEVDRCVVAVGRKPATEKLIDPSLGIAVDAKGFIEVNEQCQTSISNVYAIGDAVRGPMLAHKGSEEGAMVAEIIAGKKVQVNYAAIPSVIYTFPEVAWVGKTEQECKDQGIEVKSGSFPFQAIGRAKANHCTDGMVRNRQRCQNRHHPWCTHSRAKRW